MVEHHIANQKSLTQAQYLYIPCRICGRHIIIFWLLRPGRLFSMILKGMETIDTVLLTHAM